MDITTNVTALAAAANLNKTQNMIAASTAKLSSGFRINTAADDAAGLGIANKLNSDIGAYQQASRNASQANSIYSIAEGAATSIQGMLNQMKQLAAEAASDTVDSNGRVAINQEFTQLQAEIDRTVNTTKFQGNTLLNGAFGATVDSGSTALTVATAGVYNVQISGAAIGSYTLSAGSNVGTTIQNYQAAEGTIKDVNMATEMVSYSTNQILAQAGTAMLAQANQAGSSVLKLLQ